MKVLKCIPYTWQFLFNLNFVDVMVTSLSMRFTSSQIQSIGRNEGRIIKILSKLPSKNRKTCEDYCCVYSSFSHEISSYCTWGKIWNRKTLLNLMNRNLFINFYPQISCSFMISFSYTCNSFTNILALQNFLIKRYMLHVICTT